MTNEEAKIMKQRCKEDIIRCIDRYEKPLSDIDRRLYLYIVDCIDIMEDHANLYELLGIRKVLRLMDTYIVNGERVQKYIRAIEGNWEGRRYVSGGLKFSTPNGLRHVPLMPYQVWCLFGMYGFDTEVDMQRPWHNDEMHLPSEFERNGNVWDRRRLCTEAHIFQTRKSGKTEFGGAIDFVEVTVFGPYNAQVLICCNSKDQAKIAYKAIKDFCYQVDPDSKSKAGGKYFRVTADEMNWLPNDNRAGEIKVMSAGGKTKDGLFASLVHADEHGSAAYVADHSDMQSLVDVCVGSMGPRRERMLLHTTTAGVTNMGPYQIQLMNVEDLLLQEMTYPLGEPHESPEDRWFAFLLRLDPWEVGYSLDELDNEVLFRKVNRSIGITVQPTWYKERLHDARLSDDTLKEVLTKDFNIWQTGRVKQWISAEDIRPLMVPCHIEDLRAEDGWVAFVGCDFSKGDDLNALSALCYNTITGAFFADCVAWITEETLHTNPNAALYQLLVQQGWLRVCPGRTIDENMVLAYIVEVSQHVNIMRIGYDAYDAKRFVNAFSAWIFSLGEAPTAYLTSVSQTYATYNSPVQELEYFVKLGEQSPLRFSQNILWPWEFGNCVLKESNDGMENVKPVKATANGKVDNVQCLCSALYLYDQMQGTVNK